MKKVYIFGAGYIGSKVAETLENVEILGVLDNSPEKHGKICFPRAGGVKCLGDASYMQNISSDSYDEVIVTSIMGIEVIPKELLGVNVPPNKINTSYVVVPVWARIFFLENFSRMYNAKFSEDACVAEGGVYQGEFAKEINRLFPERKLYLFDTFEGFDERDFDREVKNYSSESYLKNTDVNLVLDKLPHKERVVIRQGYFSETIEGMPDEKFCFVNLDFDLYKPTLAGLEYFVPRLVKNGLILIHDYFNSLYPGVSKAVREFMTNYEGQVHLLPIGDNFSVAIIVD